MPALTPNVPQVTDTATFDAEGLPAGTHHLQLVVEDDAGNRSDPAVVTIEIVARTPSINDMVPPFGAWGDTVVLRGANFDPQPAKNTVRFQNAAAKVAAASPTELTVMVPQGAVSGAVTVNNQWGSAKSPFPFLVPVTFTVAVGAGPADLAWDPVKNEVWVVNSAAAGRVTTGSVSVVSLDGRNVVATIAVGTAPRDIALSRARERRVAVVTNSGSGTASVIDMDARRAIATLEVGPQPRGVDISADGMWAYVVVSGTDPGKVVAIDLRRPALSGSFPVGKAPTRVIFSSGREAFINNTGDGTLSVADSGTHTVTQTVRAGGGRTSNPQQVAVGGEPFPAWSANPGSQTASIVAANGSVVDVPVEIAAGAVAVMRDGSVAVLAGDQQNAFTRVDASTGRRPAVAAARTISPAGGPESIALSPDQSTVAVVHPAVSRASFFDLRSMKLLATTATADAPVRCVAAAGWLCAICEKGNALTAVDWKSILP